MIISSKLDQRTRNPLSLTTKFKRAEELGWGGKEKPYRRGEAAGPRFGGVYADPTVAAAEKECMLDSGEESLIMAEPGGSKRRPPRGNLALRGSAFQDFFRPFFVFSLGSVGGKEKQPHE